MSYTYRYILIVILMFVSIITIRMQTHGGLKTTRSNFAASPASRPLIIIMMIITNMILISSIRIGIRIRNLIIITMTIIEAPEEVAPQYFQLFVAPTPGLAAHREGGVGAEVGGDHLRLTNHIISNQIISIVQPTLNIVFADKL